MRAKPHGVAATLSVLASLRLTVALFALSIFLVFAGTLAQVDHDILYVLRSYFRTFFAWVEWRALLRFVEKFVWDLDLADKLSVQSGFYFPGGWTLGGAMFVNLLAAHALRFRVTARGLRLAAGLGVIALGLLATFLVVQGGSDGGLRSQLSPEIADSVWQGLRIALNGLALLGAYWLTQTYGAVRRPEWLIALAAVCAVGGSAAFLLMNPDWKLNPSGLRILWQLLQGGGAAALLLAGCWLAFNKRAGIVLLHGGVGLLMLSELYTGLNAVETRMQIDEGATVDWAYNPHKVELAVIDASDPAKDRTTVVPESLLVGASSSTTPLSHADLPFDVRVLRYYVDSHLAPPAKSPSATLGAGLGIGAEERAPEAGEDLLLSGERAPSAYIELLDKTDGGSLGVMLVSVWGDAWVRLLADAPVIQQARQALDSQTVTVQGKAYQIALRFQRVQKPYAITLQDFRFDRYLGVETAKNFESRVHLVDSQARVDRDVRIYMNNPLRYRGDTLYQADFDKADEKTTVLQVVSNEGWMVPYVSCMLVAVGMLAHFAITLGRFLGRRDDATLPTAAATERNVQVDEPRASWSNARVWFPLLMALVFGGYVAGKARPPKDAAGAPAVQEFGALPVVQGGRVKPFDTLARTTLQVLSNRQEITTTDGGRMGATEWLLRSISGRPGARDLPVLRIENLELIETLGLERRPGSYRYTINELAPKFDEFERQVALATQTSEGERSVYQLKVLELAGRLSTYRLVMQAFDSPRISANAESALAEIETAGSIARDLRRGGAPRAAFPAEPGGEWRTLFEGELLDLFARATGKPGDPATGDYVAALSAFRDEDTRAFNEAVFNLSRQARGLEEAFSSPEHSELNENLAASERLSGTRVRFEQFFNAFAPLYQASTLYVVAFLLAVASWLGWRRPLSRASTAVIATALVIHTLAIVARIYISGRPPVTNLYSSAVFIGWASALFAVSLETIYRVGIGNVMASVLGFLTLIVAYFLSFDSDTFDVLQAVLDTQFWLATHVVTITLGYATTLLAGFLSAGYLIAGHALGAIDPRQQRDIQRMSYGVLCFAILFSFVGTVLGGLWADDSWGRFWGWDPKENGALLIVLWNALVLHARWGKLSGPVGLAALTVAGNIVTAWSWFGTNELGIGLHSYGFTEGRATWLAIFSSTQLVVIALAALPGRKAAV